ncbi:MAG: hypothetical protein MJK04_05770, partial [Psychrosphaera sp.]|nr:hypothetical protein [Psychrosphaera sp.]
MKMFLLGFIVRADTGRSQFESAKRIDALGWIRCADANTALLKARFEIESDGWKIVKLEQPPVEVSRQLSIEDDTVRAQFEKAVKKGAAFIYSVVGGDFKATGPVVLERDTGIDIGLFLETQKKLKRTGRCLHFNAGHQCNAVINAHSVQKGQSLVSIAVDGKVYGLAEKMSDYGKAQFIKKGIKIFSTFRGFCKKHDNAVFLPIDTRALIPNEQQVLLYAYRSICMEVFVKENSLNLYNLVINETKKDSPLLQQFKSNLQGTKNGL